MQPYPATHGRVLSVTIGEVGEVFDPRDRRGRRWPLLPVLHAAQCAVLTGAKTYVEITEWLHHSPQLTRWRLGFTKIDCFGAHPVPPMATVRRLILVVHPDGLADLLRPRPRAGRLARLLALDGKSARGSRSAGVTAAHLLAGCDENAQVVAQMRVPDKTNEIPCVQELLAHADLSEAWVTLDALHTQVATANFLVKDKNAHFVLAVKRNQPSLYEACRRLPWQDARARHSEVDVAHGRRERRTTTVLSCDVLPFPHVKQVARIYRTRTDRATGRQTREIVYIVTDLTSSQAKPHQLAAAIRGHWRIENKIHFVRDEVWQEDRSRIRTGHGPENMATLRNIAMNLIRASGAVGIARKVRELSYDRFTAPLDLLGLPG